MSHKKNSAVRNTVFGAFVLSLALPLSAVASSHISEIVVSVRKMDENLQEIPVQVNVFGEQVIEQERIRSLSDVAELTPSLTFDTGFWPSDTRVTIRGLFNRAGRPSAAVLIDGIDAMSESIESAGGSALLNQRILDIKRIEVARGPQSALYGRGAFAGAINYVTRRPPDELTASLSADVTSKDHRGEFQGMIGGPIIENVLNFNVTLSDYKTTGFYKNPNTNQFVGGGKSRGGSFALEWLPSEDVNVYWNTTYTDDEFEPMAVAAIKANVLRVLLDDGTLIEDGTMADCPGPRGGDPGENACLNAFQGTIDADESMIDASPDPRTATAGSPFGVSNYSGTDDETIRSSLIIDWDINENYAFRSATSITDSDQALKLDIDQQFAGMAPPIGTGFDSDANFTFEFKQYYQEFQVSHDSDGPVNWLLGFNAFKEEAENLNRSRFWYLTPLVCPFVGSGPVCPVSFDTAARANKTVERDTTSYSLFGLMGIDLSDNVKLTLEGRYIYDEIKIYSNTSDSIQDALFDDFIYPGTPGFRDKTSATNLVPRVSLDWFVSDNAMIYTSAAKGIKPPTYNTTDLIDPAVAAVDKEKLWTYEVGAKTSWDNNRVILNGALFYNDYKDQQVLVQFPALDADGEVDPDGQPRSGTANAGNVDVWGLEIDATWRPDENWLLNLSYAHTEGDFEDFVLRDAQPAEVPVSTGNQAMAASRIGDFSGNDTPGVPENALTFLARYQAQLSGDTNWYAQLSANWQDERWADVSNLAELDSYWKANGQIGLEQDNWFVSLYVENMFDDDTVTYAQEFIDQQIGFQTNVLTFPVAYYAYLPQPRTVGLKFQYKTR
ncbi:MAG TPA: TonB-dependent receptor [Gammaproteobacteria bacterium]|nr:TonB-dependent receptor [Gammaproteobacteria bacterium]